MELLRAKRTTGAEVDSSERFPPPRCHPETRKTIRDQITTWITKPDDDWNMFWILGPAGVGKSAIAQTIAEDAKENGRLGAAFFVSRPHRRNDPLRIIPTLAHQLAVEFPEYRHMITQRILDNPTILEKDLSSQFKLLIAEPFNNLQEDKRLKSPFLVVLDGLDECNDKEAQCTFIRLISGHARQKENAPLLWLVFSRPEWHLKRLLPTVDPTIKCHHEDLLIDGVEGRDDVYRFLCDGFTDIRRRFRDEVDDHWPSEDDIVRLATVSSGLFVFASTVLKFVGDDLRNNPVAQLKICLQFVSNACISGSVNPLATLDLLYYQILVDIPSSILPTTMDILCLCLMATQKHRTSPCDIANILHLDKATFYAAIRGLHSVLDIPSAADAVRKSIRFYHASFQDFLRDPLRSGTFHRQEAEARCNVAIHCLHWQNTFLSPDCRLAGSEFLCVGYSSTS